MLSTDARDAEDLAVFHWQKTVCRVRQHSNTRASLRWVIRIKVHAKDAQGFWLKNVSALRTIVNKPIETDSDLRHRCLGICPG